MRWIFLTMIILQGALVSGIIDKINIKGVEVPIIYEKNSALPIVSLQLVVTNAGSLQDGSSAGIARFTSRILGEGTKRKGAIKFADELESKAINLNAHAGAETFVFELSSLKEQFSFGIWMLKDLLGDPNFSKNSFEKIQQLTLGGLSSKKSDFDYIANLNLKKMIFKDTPLENSFSGDEQSIKKLTIEEVKKFYESYIDLSNMIIVVGGDINMDEVKVSLKELLEDIQVGKKRELKHYKVNEKVEENRVVKETEQAYIYFGAPYNLQSDSKEIYKSRVASFILGASGFGSRLMEEIRVKRGLAYSAYARTSINRSNSYFSGHLQTKNENLEEAKALVKSEIKRFVDGGVTQNELDQAKRFLLGSEPLRNETLSQRLNSAFTEYYRGFELGHSKAELDKIEALSLENLNKFIKQHDEINNLSFSIVTDAKNSDKLKKLGVSNLLDLALFIPKSYENTYLNKTPVLNEFNTLHVKVLRSHLSRVLSLRFYVEAWEQEINGVVFSPRPYHRALFKVEESLYVRGKIEWNQGNISIIQPIAITQINTILPKYKTPLQNRTMIALIKQYLTYKGLKEEGLSDDEAEVIMSLHFPSSTCKDSLSEKALRVVKFLEIYNFIKKLSKKKKDFEPKSKLSSSESDFIQSLPFELTRDQKNTLKDIKEDFNSNKAARRIVMGDVGSGKTMVILASVIMCYPKRAVLMAPTTILAKQLFEEAKKFLPLHVKSILVVSATSKKEDLNQYDFIVGTHALLHRKLPDFDLVMVDEQHRFGTKQRELINQLSIDEGKHPHFLQFSATPIPRTMSMIQSSLVDFSFIKQTPFKKDIDTRIIRKPDFKNLTEHIKHEIKEGRQVIVIYPLVEESETIEYQSIEEARGYWEKNYKNVFITYGADKEKEEVLESFKDSGDILIATTLVEVGISLPKLSTIVIVGAERLGLATLHQLRGRVSRNGLKGYCFLYTNQNQSKRLDEFKKTNNGFDIAELDLRYRKGGDVLGGLRQSGQKFEYYDMEEDILLEAKRRLGKL